jgi:hypothetical protein
VGGYVPPELVPGSKDLIVFSRASFPQAQVFCLAGHLSHVVLSEMGMQILVTLEGLTAYMSMYIPLGLGKPPAYVLPNCFLGAR